MRKGKSSVKTKVQEENEKNIQKSTYNNYVAILAEKSVSKTEVPDKKSRSKTEFPEDSHGMSEAERKAKRWEAARFFESLKREPDRQSGRILLLYFAAISVLELLACTAGGIFSAVAARLWMLGGLICLLAFVSCAGSRLAEDLRKRRYLVPAGFAALLLIYGSFIGNIGYADINPDAAQQAAAGLRSFSAGDWNYTGVAFLGYANRQYLLAALPAALFGRSILTLHLGFALPFLIGLTMLFLELRSWLKQHGQKEALALIPVYAMTAFRFIPEYYLNFEQAITPVALTMMGIALFMRLYRAPDVIGIFCLSWVGCLFCDSYTPVLASLGLLLCFLVLFMLELLRNAAARGKRDSGRGSRTEQKTPSEKKSPKTAGKEQAMPDSMHPEARRARILAQTLVGLTANIVCFFLATLLAHRSDRVNSFRENVDLISFAAETWGEFFTDSNAVFLGIFSGAVLLYLFLSLLGRLKFRDFTISCWTFGVVLFANYLAGYTTYQKAWILQRNMIIIPVLVTAIFLALMRFLKRYSIAVSRPITVCLVLFFMAAGLVNFHLEHQSFTYFSHIQPLKFMIAYTEDTLEEYGVLDTDEFNLVLYTDNVLQSNLQDYGKFFYPNAHIYSLKSGETPQNLDWSMPTFLFGESGEVLAEFGPDIKRRSYRNPRYRTTVVWYRSVKIE